MRTVTVCKALPLTPDRPTPEVTISVTELVPDLHGTTIDEDGQIADRFYRAEAQQIAEALCASLPGGTFDRLVVLLLDMKSSQLKVAYPPRKE